MKKYLFVSLSISILIASGIMFIKSCNKKSEFKVLSSISIDTQNVNKEMYVSRVNKVEDNDDIDIVNEQGYDNSIIYKNENAEDNKVIQVSDVSKVISNDTEEAEKIGSSEKKEIPNILVEKPVEVKEEILMEEPKEIIQSNVDVNEVDKDINNIDVNGVDKDINDIDVNEVDKDINNIDDEKHYYSPSGKDLGKNNVKVIDVSYHQGTINWDTFAKEADVYGVILRIGYWKTLDKQFVNNVNALKRLNIPYGIYIYSYASTISGAKIEANFTNKVISEYGLSPSLGIYYDIESWNTGSGNSDGISKSDYDNIVGTYVDVVNSFVNNSYKVKVYSGRWYAMNRFGALSKSYVDWVAEYNATCKYDGNYSMWQYTSNGSVPGINGRVDISYIK